MSKRFLSLLVVVSFWASLSLPSVYFKQKDHAHTHASLQALYEADNELYYNNSLPHNVKVVEAEAPWIPNDGKYVIAETIHEKGSDYTIYISPTYNLTETDAEESILHEGCHIKVYQDREAENREYTYEESHGDDWQNCMKRLARMDAFREIW